MSAAIAHQADRHRQRAARLRRFAAQLEDSPVLRLDRHAGDDTWSGPTPDRLLVDLSRLQHRLHVEAEQLRSAAWWLDRRADDLEREAALLTLTS